MIDGQVALGFGLALAAGACYDTAYALQALEARRVGGEHALRPSLFGKLLRRPRWVAGTALSVAGWPLQVLALTLAPLTLVQPTLALGLLLLLYLGVRLLGEHVGTREIAAVLAIIAGVAVIAWAAPERSTSVAGGWRLALSLGLLGALTLSPYVLGARRRSGVLLLILGAGAADGCAGFLAKLISDELTGGRLLAALGWALVTGLAALLGFLSEMTALQRRPATRVAPFVLVMQVVIPVVLAALVGGENWGATPLGGAVLAGGLLLVAAGTALLGGSRAVADVIAAEAAKEGQPRAAASTSEAAEGSSA